MDTRHNLSIEQELTCSFATAKEAKPFMPMENTDNMGMLFYKFLRDLGGRWDFKRTGCYVAQGGFRSLSEPTQALMLIEDPIEPYRNIGKLLPCQLAIYS
jgi:hypothetical protein